MKKHNFSAGPAILPASVMQEAAQAAVDFNGMGLSILEISHRSAEFTAVLEEAVQSVKDLLHLTDDYAVLFLSGGASSQFFMTAMNLLNPEDRAGYVDTGSWSAKAIKEAKNFGQVEVLASSKADNYGYIPKGYSIPTDLKYVHLTSNNTIFGTQYHEWPETDVPFICDMSSDIFSRPVDISRYGIIYAGAQKNMGPAGTTLVVIRKDLLGKVNRAIPSMLDYRIHIDKESTFNTPPVFPIYVSMLTLRWVKANGGLEGMQKHNEAKAKILYDEIDRNPLFKGNVTKKEDRSLMNATFILEDSSLEADFLADCKAAGCVGVKGHRSAGGFRASIYNAMSKESVQVLADLMQEFAKKKGQIFMAKKQERQTVIKVASLRVPLKVIWERRRNIRAAIGKRAVLLRLPMGYPVNEAEEIEKIKGWLTQLHDKKEGVLDRLAIKEFETGQVLTVGTRQYLLEIHFEDRKTHTAQRVGHKIILVLAEEDGGPNLQRKIRHLLSRIVAQDFLPEITRRVLDLNDQHFQKQIKGVRLKYNFSNWGSCSSTGNINLSTRLLFAPPEVIDYVIIHELAHLFEMNHSARFWNIVAKAMPSYKQKEKWLKQNGHLCDFQ